MAYIGQGIKQGTFKVLDTSGNTYNGSNTTFSLGTQVGAAAQLLVSHDGVIQLPGTDYTLASGGASITFSTAPASGASIFIVEISGAVGGTVTPSDASVTSAKLSGNLETPGTLDVNGQELILDADGDTSITADTDDQIDIKVAGADDFQIVANNFKVLSGSTLTIESGGTITNSGTASGFGALAGIDDQSSSNDDQITITDTAVVINEDSDDVDFRVESNGNANMLFVSGGNDVVGIGAEGDLGNGLHVKSADSGASVANEADELVVEGSGDTGLSILSGTDANGSIMFGDSADNDGGRIQYNPNNDRMMFTTNGSERMRIDSSGNLLHAKTSNNSNNAGIELRPGGELTITRTNNQLLDINRTDNDGTLVTFRQANTTEGIISVSGGTVTYISFAGSHWSRLADNSKPTILRGTILESISTLIDWYQVEYTKDEETLTEYIGALPDDKSVGDSHTVTVNGVEYTGTISKEDNERLPKCKISDTEDSKAVYGVFMDWDNDDNNVNDMYVAALGAFVVRIHKDETVAIGDYLQSKGDGTAKKQADDILRASTIAKVTSTEKTHEYADGSYCVPCTLHCG